MTSVYVIPKRLRPLAARIAKACQLARRAGWRIAPGSYQNERRKCMCPLGALHFVLGTSVTAGIPGLDQEDESEFVWGFDDYSYAKGPYAKLGAEFRKRFMNETSQVP